MIAKLSDAIKVAVHGPDFRDRLKTMGFALTWGTPEEYADNIRREVGKYERAVKLTKIQPE